MTTSPGLSYSFKNRFYRFVGTTYWNMSIEKAGVLFISGKQKNKATRTMFTHFTVLIPLLGRPQRLPPPSLLPRAFNKHREPRYRAMTIIIAGRNYLNFFVNYFPNWQIYENSTRNKVFGLFVPLCWSWRIYMVTAYEKLVKWLNIKILVVR